MPSYRAIITSQGYWPEVYYPTIIRQLKLGNRLELICGLSHNWVDRRIIINGRDVPHTGITGETVYIWVTNDERRRILREIN